MKIRIVKISKFLILFFWLVMTALLVLRNTSFLHHSAIAEGFFRPEDSEEWMGIYFQNKKVGYVNTIHRKEGDFHRIIEKSFLKLKVMERVREVRTLVNSLFDTRGIIKSFNFRIDSGDINLEAEGVAKGKDLIIKLKTGGISREEIIPLSGSVYLPQSIRLFFKEKKLKKGEKFSINLIDPSILKTGDMTFEVLGEDRIIWEGTNVHVFKVKSSFMGIESISFINDNGEVLKEEGPLGTTAVRESKEEAINKGWGREEETDFILATAIPVNEVISDPSSLSYLKLRISGIDLETLDLNRGRQKLSGNILEIRKENVTDENYKASYSLPYRDGEFAEYLKSSALIQSDSQEIISLARKIINNTKDPIIASTMISRWVFNKLEKTPTISIPSAVEVLRTKKGDCNEHAILFTALARSAGIPTKIAVGLVYQKGYFFYHAWNEVFLGEWISIDPTFNQFPADVTHIKLAEGDVWEWLKITNVVGNLRVEILDMIGEY